MDVVVGNLQGHHKGIIVWLDDSYSLFTGESNGLGSRWGRLCLVSAVDLDTSSLSSSFNMLFVGLVRGSQVS